MFQSAPLTKARGDLAVVHQIEGAVLVSIRSPHQSKGRLPPVIRETVASMFQSAPLTKARGDASIVRPASILSVFQSAPLTKARGDF